jgi:hypothetical protein
MYTCFKPFVEVSCRRSVEQTPLHLQGNMEHHKKRNEVKVLENKYETKLNWLTKILSPCKPSPFRVPAKRVAEILWVDSLHGILILEKDLLNKPDLCAYFC